MHPSDIEVHYDEESGVVTFTITSDNAESLNDIVTDMQEAGFEDGLTVVDGIIVEAYVPPSDVVASVDVVVDASNVSDVNDAVESTVQALQQQDPNVDVESEGMFHHPRKVMI